MLRNVPIIQQYVPTPSDTQLAGVDRAVNLIRRERPELARDLEFQQHTTRTLEDGPSLHLDDLSQISFVDAIADVQYALDRARLRAGEGDIVATSLPVVPGFEEYVSEKLGLGSVTWLNPQPLSNPLQIAEACWEDRHVRRELMHRLRDGRLNYLHPNMGTFAVWELARLLSEASRQPVRVIAPPPALCRWVNDKVIFARTVSQLLGSERIPRTASAWNLSTLTKHVAEIAASARCLCLKLAGSAGGDGTVLLNTDSLREMSTVALSQLLAEKTARIGWNGTSHLLVNQWESDVLASPSVQTWIPPLGDGPPIVEGIFSQLIKPPNGEFVGAAAAALPDDLAEALVIDCWLLTLLYQRLGYVGRCSFDAILVGENWSQCRIELIECNGRWGGTSAPMTMMNRLFGDWMLWPFAVRNHLVPGLSQMTFAELRSALSTELYDRQTGAGSLILFNPDRFEHRSDITVLVRGRTAEEAIQRSEHEVPRLLNALVRRRHDSVPPPPQSNDSVCRQDGC